MQEEGIKTVMATTAAAMAHMGSISKEDALAMSGLDEKSFNELLAKVARAADQVKAEPGRKHEGFYDIVSTAVNDALDKA